MKNNKNKIHEFISQGWVFVTVLFIILAIIVFFVLSLFSDGNKKTDENCYTNTYGGGRAEVEICE